MLGPTGSRCTHSGALVSLCGEDFPGSRTGYLVVRPYLVIVPGSSCAPLLISID